MSKKISLIKKFNKLLISVNERIESFFNGLKVLVNSKNKIKNYVSNFDKKIPISIGSVIILILSYFFIPSFYNKDLVKTKLRNQILEKYNLEVKFEGSLEYGLFPKPHYFIKDTIITYNEKNLAKVNFTKIYINSNNFFSSEKIKVKKLLFRLAEFDINYDNYIFFKKVLDSNKDKDDIQFKNSKLFYKDKNEDVLFLTNIKNLEFLYNDEFNQELNTELEIFNIPLKIKIINDFQNKKYFINIASRKLRINIQNNFFYGKEKIDGLVDLKVFNKLKKIDYEIDRNSLTFKTREDNVKGKLDFKPFYLTTDLEFQQLDLGKIFNNNSIFLDLLKTEILNNQSLNALVNIDFDKIKNVAHLKNFTLKAYFEEGSIILKDSNLNWKNSTLINLDNVLLINENNEIIFTGEAKFNFDDIDEFYKQYQVKKINRKEIKEIKVDFMFNLYDNVIQFDNLKIDGNLNKDLDSFQKNFNSKKINIFNKVLLKNSIKEFFGYFKVG